MIPYYQDKYVTIYNACCEDILPFLGNFDLLLTDPPYGIGESNAQNATRGFLASPTNFGEYSWDESRPSLDLINLFRGKAQNQIIFGGNFFDLPSASCYLVWDKDNGQNDFADCELAWTNLKMAVRKFKYRWNGMLQERMGKDKEKRVHPTQKPLALMKWCLSLVPKAQTILDPFMGSGTTLVAAKDNNLIAVGIEQDKRYCDIAIERLKQEVFEFVQ